MISNYGSVYNNSTEISYNYKNLKDINPNALKKFQKVFEISKGKLNSQLALMLAFCEEFTPEDIIKKMELVDNESFSKVFSYGEVYRRDGRKTFDRGEHRAITRAEHKQLRRDNRLRYKNNGAHTYDVIDTFIYKYVKKYGFTEHFEGLNYGNSIDCRRGTSRGHSSYYNDLKNNRVYQNLLMFFSLDNSLKDFVSGNETIKKLWIDHGYVQKRYNYGSSPSYILTEEEFENNQIKCIAKDFESIMYMPEDLFEEFEKFLEQNNLNNKNMFSNVVTQHIRNWEKDDSAEYAKQVYEVMDYIGIGIVANPKKNTTYYRNYTKSAKNLEKKIISSVRTFNSNIKKGFDIEDVRQILVEDLNNYIETKMENNWLVFIRKDAKKNYPELAPKKKKSE